MREISQIIQRKGEGLVRELEAEIRDTRSNLTDFSTINQHIKAETKINTLKSVIKQVKAVFELED